ncbi:hypothetical protein H9P43_006213 [Blastocladiella emersonii ATCC 22665]|nr:hypothetical protein H9P43_006213 [Blastocladiella emersonii ATCC 22665]
MPLGKQVRRCQCLNCCGLPAPVCRAMWVILGILVTAMAVASMALNVYSAKCRAGGADTLVLSDEGTLDLQLFPSTGVLVVDARAVRAGSVQVAVADSSSDSAADAHRMRYKIAHYALLTPGSTGDLARATIDTSTPGANWRLVVPAPTTATGAAGTVWEAFHCSRAVVSLTFPAAHLRANATRYAVRVQSEAADVRFDGPAAAQGIAWDAVTLETTTGNVRASVLGPVARRATVTTESGVVDIASLAFAPPPVNSTEAAVAPEVDVLTTDGPVSLVLAAVPVNVTGFSVRAASSGSGNVGVRVPAGLDATWKVSATQGVATVAGTRVASSGSGSGVFGTGGKGGQRTITARANRGNAGIEVVG